MWGIALFLLEPNGKGTLFVRVTLMALETGTSVLVQFYLPAAAPGCFKHGSEGLNDELRAKHQVCSTIDPIKTFRILSLMAHGTHFSSHIKWSCSLGMSLICSKEWFQEGVQGERFSNKKEPYRNLRKWLFGTQALLKLWVSSPLCISQRQAWKISPWLIFIPQPLLS